MAIINENNVIQCEVCFDERPDYIPLMTCGHLQNFCEKCLRKWFAEGYSTCPKCRAILPIQCYVS